ncbi:MAG: YkgJ family cysteine cluster protein [Hyphomicrobium sp.]
MTVATSDLVPGRTCDGCTLCCKLLEIDIIEKPRGTWCVHCDKSRGCKIYEQRPEPCRGFHCGYLRIPHLDERWKPSKAKFLINFEERANRVAIHADPGLPDVWRREPFISTIRGWAANAGRDGGYVIVWTGQRAVIVMPGREKDLGMVRDDQVIVAVETRPAAGPVRDFIVVEPDDPRAQGSSPE